MEEGGREEGRGKRRRETKEKGDKGEGRQGKRCTGNKEARLEQRKNGRIAKEEGFSLLTFHV